MTRQEFETLRGEAIRDNISAEAVPCVEISDADRLCKRPLVSVCMTTYNHAKYIREAIEGVMMQNTDFEFELVIGEDASTDGTREICFEYQKRYPDKIRVLWSEKNVYAVDGNEIRVKAHCRGEYVAICEGDDFWIDPLKLQKQVDVLKANKTVAFCFCGSRFVTDKNDQIAIWDPQHTVKSGFIKGSDFFKWHIFGLTPEKTGGAIGFIMTATVMYRKDAFERAKERFPIFGWCLSMSDSTHWLGLAAVGDVYYLDDVVSTYRQVSTGACRSGNGRVEIDAILIKSYFAEVVLNIPFADMPATYHDQFWYNQMKRLNARGGDRWSFVRSAMKIPMARKALFKMRSFPLIAILLSGARSSFAYRIVEAYLFRMPSKKQAYSVLMLYEKS